MLTNNNPEISAIDDWYLPYMVVLMVTTFCCLLAIWQMKKIGVDVYIGVFFANEAVMIWMGGWHPYSIILPLIVIAVLVAYRSRMT